MCQPCCTSKAIGVSYRATFSGGGEGCKKSLTLGKSLKLARPLRGYLSGRKKSVRKSQNSLRPLRGRIECTRGPRPRACAYVYNLLHCNANTDHNLCSKPMLYSLRNSPIHHHRGPRSGQLVLVAIHSVYKHSPQPRKHDPGGWKTAKGGR